MANKASRAINRPKLIRELAVVFGVILVIFLVRFLPWLAEQPVPWYDPSGKYLTLLRDVESYDYSKGKNTKLEKRLINGTASAGSSPVQYYYNLKAKATYYYNVADYLSSLEALNEAVRFAPSSDETNSVYGLYIKNYRALGQGDKAKEYEELRDARPF
jgi:hypothetical protein